MAVPQGLMRVSFYGLGSPRLILLITILYRVTNHDRKVLYVHSPAIQPAGVAARKQDFSSGVRITRLRAWAV